MDNEKNFRNATTFSRLPEISLLNVIFCILVIFIHVSAEPVTLLDKSTFAYASVFIPWRLSSFVVQGFLMLSGIKLFLKTENDFRYFRFIVKRLKSVYLPYVLWVGAYYLWFIYLGYFSFSLGDLAHYIFAGDLVGHFYFVIAAMQFYFFMPLWRVIVKRVPASAAIPTALILMLILSQNLPSIVRLFFPSFDFLYTDRAFTTYIFYFLTGCYIGKSYAAFKEALQKSFVPISMFFAVTGLCDGALSFAVFKGSISAPYLEMLHVLYIMSAIMFFFALSNRLCSRREKLPRLISAIDRASYPIYLSHPLAISAFDYYFGSSFSTVKGRYAVRFFVTYAVTLTACISYYIIKRRFSTHEKQK